MFLEAPVGTGKSLGVLVPCSIYSREKRTVYYMRLLQLIFKIKYLMLTLLH